jgi:serine/threonine protein kinase/chemotaxis signal transduction protein
MKLCQTCHTITSDEHNFCAHDGLLLVHDALSTVLQGSLGAKYTLTKLIGTGSMGAVYRARHQDLDDVAIKVMLGPPDNHKLSQRFLREARALRKLHNPHSVLVYDLERSSTGLTYMVMEMVEGRSIRDVLKERGQLPLEETLEVAEAVCDALQAAHERGIIHRDLKPDNILIAEEKTAGDETERIIKIADFGIAKLRGTREGGEDASMQLTKHGTPIGTPFYMSPEQWFGDGTGFTALDGRTDIYSLGCTLYEMLTGQPPFIGTTTEEMRRKHLNDVPQPLNELEPRVPESLSRVILRALEKDRDLRPATAEEFAEELRRAIEESMPAAQVKDAPPAPLPTKAVDEENKEEASRRAEQITKLQKTEEAVPMVRNWAAEEMQQAIEQMRARPATVQPPQAPVASPINNEEPTPPAPESISESTVSAVPSQADTFEDVEDTLPSGRLTAEDLDLPLDTASSGDAEFQKTLPLDRKEKRAQEEAQETVAKTSGKGSRLELMVARVGSKRIALMAHEVETVAEWRTPLPLPNAPASILGVVNVRGRMLTLLDPRALIGEEKKRRPLAQPVSIIALRGDEQLALAVNSVEGSIETNIEEKISTAENGNAVCGIAHLEQGTITVLDARELFSAATRSTERRRQRTS